MADALLTDLPRDLPSFLERFGTDAQCRAYLVQARWPEGFRCGGCGHDRAYSHHKRLIEECRACGRQHSILAGTLFEQTKTGLARWFLAIYLVTSSKGGISAMELQRQMGFGSYGTAWTWLHKIRRAMVHPDRRRCRTVSRPTRPSSVAPAGQARPRCGRQDRGRRRDRGRPRQDQEAQARPAPTPGRDASAGPASSASSPPTSPSPPPSPPTAGAAIPARSRRLPPRADHPRELLGRGP